jgi:hypothetical protein
MATYGELRALFGEDALRHKVEVACIVAAETIRNEAPATENHANRLVWAKSAFQDPAGVAVKMLMALLAANKDETPSNITSASDAQIQARVDAAVDVFADGS